MKPKVLLVAPTKYYYNNVSPEPVKHHLLALLSHLADIAEVDVLDLENLFGYPRSAEEIAEWLRRAEQQLAGRRPDLIGVSCYTSYDYLCTVDLLRLCARLFPGVTKVVGGYHPTAVPEDFTSRDVPVDAVIRGEGEVALRALLEGAAGSDAPVVDGPPLDLCEERPLRYDLYPYRTSDLCLALSRGCPFTCSFCVQSDEFPNGYRRLDLDQIHEKLRRAAAHLPLRRIMFVDPFFGVQRKHTLELLELLTREFSHLQFWAETRIDCVRAEWLEKLAGLQLDLHFGVESLAPDTIRLMNKARDPSAYIASFEETLELCQRWQVLARCGFIMNYPGEVPRTATETLSRIERAIERFDRLCFTFHCNQYALYPGNEIYHRRQELARDRGFRFPNDGWWRQADPQIRKRSEHCFASWEMVKTFGEDPGFWRDEVFRLGKRCASKHTSEAFRFYRRSELLESLRHHYPEGEVDDWHLEPWRAQFDLVAFLRYRLTDIYHRYDGWLDEDHTDKKPAFLKLFNLVTSEYQSSLLRQYDAGASVERLRDRCELLHGCLLEELERNLGQGIGREEAAEGQDLELELMGLRYRLASGDRVFRLEYMGEERRA